MLLEVVHCILEAVAMQRCVETFPGRIDTTAFGRQKDCSDRR
jgi:hypothetical protein